ncbi:basic amino acid ABC transporter substrate-binding protein [Candidatus Zixiibacteriota bacterium]
MKNKSYAITAVALGIFSLATIIALVGCGGSGETDTWAEITSDGIWRVGTDATYPPFETVDTDIGEVVGFDIDLISAICTKYEVQPEFIITPFDGIVPGLTTKKYDAIISAFTITPERARQVLFSDPYYDAGQMIAVPLDDTVTVGLDDLEGKQLGCQLGTTGERMAHRVPGAEIFSYESIGAAFLDLENGRLDAVINDEPTSRIIVAQRKSAKLVGKRLSDEQYGIAVRKSDSTLAMKINTALIILAEDGTIDSLKGKWFGGGE